MFACVMFGLCNAGIDLVDLDINEAIMGLSLGITCWSETCDKLRSCLSNLNGKTCTAGFDSAHRRVWPGGSFGSHGCFRTAPSVQHRIGWMSLSSLSKMPTWKRQPLWTLMLRGLWRVCCLLDANGCDGDNKELCSSANFVSVKRMETTVLIMRRAVPRLTIRRIESASSLQEVVHIQH